MKVHKRRANLNMKLSEAMGKDLTILLIEAVEIGCGIFWDALTL